MQSRNPLDAIPDDELLRRLVELLHHSRATEAELVAHVGEVDARRLYAREASPSMFAYCTEVLHLSEAEAYLRIAVARASREHPVLLTMLADGRLHLSAIAKLAPRLTPDNRAALLERATHKSKREVEELIAEIDPRPDLAASMRKLPERRIGTLLSSGELSLELRPDRVVSNGMGGTVPSENERADGTTADVGDRLEESRLEEGRLEEGWPRFAGSSLRRRTDSRRRPRTHPSALMSPSAPMRAALQAGRRSHRARHATSRPRSSGPSTKEMEAGAATPTRRAGGARSAKISSSTIGTRSASEAATPSRGSRSCARHTTATWLRSTTDRKPWPEPADPARACSI